jgi:hypothetical protein
MGVATMTILSAQGRRRLVTVGTLLGLGLWLEGWIGVLLLAVAADLAVSRRPFGARPICWPGLGVTAAGLALVDPALAFAFGWLVEVAGDPALATTWLSGTDDP